MSVTFIMTGSLKRYGSSSPEGQWMKSNTDQVTRADKKNKAGCQDEQFRVRIVNIRMIFLTELSSPFKRPETTLSESGFSSK